MITAGSNRFLGLETEVGLVELAGAVAPGTAFGHQHVTGLVCRLQHVQGRHTGREPHVVETDTLIALPGLATAFELVVGWLPTGRLAPAIVFANLTVTVAVAETGDPHAVDGVIIRPFPVLDEAESLLPLVHDLTFLLQRQLQPMQGRHVVFLKRNIWPPVTL